MPCFARFVWTVAGVMIFSGAVEALDPPVAQDDAFALVQRLSSTGDLFADNGNGADTDADGDPFRILYVVPHGMLGRGDAYLLGDSTGISGLSPEAAGNVRELAHPSMALGQDGQFTITHSETDQRLGEGQIALGTLEYAITETLAIDQFDSSQGSTVVIPDTDEFSSPVALISALGHAGDFNGDGTDDWIVSWYYRSGSNYLRNFAVVFGGDRPIDMADFEIENLDGSDGVLIEYSYRHALEFAPVGDVTGDGRDDLIIKYPVTDDVRLLSFDGASIRQSTFIAAPVSSEVRSYGIGGGDLNGDGIGELVFNLNYYGGGLSGRKTVVVYGRNGGFPETVDLSAMPADEGFDLGVENPSTISFLGDVNGDGRNDLGVSDADVTVDGHANAGVLSVLFGRAGDFPATLSEAYYDGVQGIRIVGDDAFHSLGVEAGPAGDLDGDGVDDFLVDYQTSVAGVAGRYRAIVYGRASLGQSGRVDASSLSTLGFVIPQTLENVSPYFNGHLGEVDVNGDGRSDLLLQFSSVDVAEAEDMSGYGIIFGGDRRSGEFALEDLDRLHGLAIFERDQDVQVCRSNIASLGDIDGDGFTDLGIGGNVSSSLQEFCVLFGGPSPFGGVFTREVSTARIDFTIHGINDPPFTRDNTFEIDEAEYLYDNLIAELALNGDDDPDDGDAIFVSAVDGDPTAVGRWRVRPEGGRLRISADGTIEFDPGTDFSALNAGDTRTIALTYRISSTDGLSADGNVTITISGISELPVAAFDLFSVPSGQEFTGNVFADNGNGEDRAPPNGVLSVRGMFLSNGYAFAGQNRTTAEGSTIRIDPDGTLTYTPSESQASPGATPEMIRYDVNLNGQSTTVRGHAALAVAGVSDDIRRVQMTVSGVETAQISASPPDVRCADSCTFTVFDGIQISFENSTPRLPDGGSADSLVWGGDCASATTTCNLTVESDLFVSLQAERSFPGPTTIFAATLPAARSAVVGQGPVTIFATVANSNRDTARFCRVSRRIGDPFAMEYQATDAANAPTGSMNPEFELAPGAFQSFVLAFTPALAFEGREFFPRFHCTNGEVAPVPGVNSVFLSASDTPSPDILSISATPSGDGVIRVLTPGGRRFMSAAAINVGAGDPAPGDVSGPQANEAAITVTADTGVAVLPLTVTVCETGPDARCLEPAGDSVTTQIGTDAKTFAVFVQASPDAGIAFDPANARVYLRFRDSGGVVRSVTSAAIIAPAPAQGSIPAGAEGRWSLGIIANDNPGGGSPYTTADLFVPASGDAILVRGVEAMRLNVSYDDVANGGQTIRLSNADLGLTLSGRVVPGQLIQLRDAATGDVIRGVHSGGAGGPNHAIEGIYTLQGPDTEPVGRVTILASGDVTANIGDCRMAGRLGQTSLAVNDNAGIANCAQSGPATVHVYPQFDVATGEWTRRAAILAGDWGVAGRLEPVGSAR